VRTVLVIETDELREQRLQVALVDDDHVVQTLSAKRPHDSLSDGVCPRSAHGRPHSGDPEAPEPRIELFAVRGVSVVNQVTRLATPRRGIDQLLPHPSGRRAGSDVELDNFPAFSLRASRRPIWTSSAQASQAAVAGLVTRITGIRFSQDGSSRQNP